MSTQSDQLKERTMQLARSATSVASNYRATCNARSRAEFIAKLGIVVEESDESEFWLDTCRRQPLCAITDVERLRNEASELRAIFGKSLGTARANVRAAKSLTRSMNQ